MSALAQRARVLALCAFTAWAGAAHALTVGELEALLRAAPKPDVKYVETRESPWLSAPVTTRGTLHVVFALAIIAVAVFMLVKNLRG